jgi:hypothetical protein
MSAVDLDSRGLGSIAVRVYFFESGRTVHNDDQNCSLRAAEQNCEHAMTYLCI